MFFQTQDAADFFQINWIGEMLQNNCNTNLTQAMSFHYLGYSGV